MCRPEHFEVSYAINPWMDPTVQVDASKAVREWEGLRETYAQLGHEVHLIEGAPGLPDMVYTANGGFTCDGLAYGTRFTHAERQPETALFNAWFEDHGFRLHEAAYTNEGEGDLLLVGDAVLAGHGFRTDPRAHEELGSLIDREVVSLRLVDPRFYHLDTCLTHLGDSIAYYPDAFDAASRAELARRFPDALTVGEDVAAVLGLNCFADGEDIVVSPKAGPYLTQLRERGWRVHTREVPELVLGGGSIKCSTLRLRR